MQTSTAGDWIGWAAVVLFGGAALLIGLVLLAARWPDVIWWLARPSVLQWEEERSRLHARIADLAVDNQRVRAERDRYRRERDAARGQLEDHQRESITVIQFRDVI